MFKNLLEASENLKRPSWQHEFTSTDVVDSRANQQLQFDDVTSFSSLGTTADVGPNTEQEQEMETQLLTFSREAASELNAWLY